MSDALTLPVMCSDSAFADPPLSRKGGGRANHAPAPDTAAPQAAKSGWSRTAPTVKMDPDDVVSKPQLPISLTGISFRAVQSDELSPTSPLDVRLRMFETVVASTLLIFAFL